ncbi:reverse transcriptase domain-containing protein [Tanacetum coccineum]|uniref:Reverse transcriptase domain-containing protein n=1 Tax=Tanacetum coccineum TaxID=301880 RepID=A0ABQ5AD02_9ASTR
MPIRRIDPVNKPYSEAQKIAGTDGVNSKHLYSASANEIDEKKSELKDLPHHLEYAYLHGNKSFLIIIVSKLSEKEKMLLLQVLEKRKGAIAWKMSDIRGISPSMCTHKILMKDDLKPVIQPQRRLNPKVQDVVKNKIVKLLDFRLICPISDSSWVSLIHVVLKKGGMTVVLNDNNELIPSRIVTGWRVCIDYRKLNDATRKDHFPLLFIDQMLERLSGNEYYCFLDGFSGFFQIPIAPEDQEKTTSTCPYGTFTYRRMPFGLCNARATFQRCMTAIFHDMMKDFMEVRMIYRKHDAKPRLIRWVLLLQGFDIEIKDKKGAENLAADHLSRLENPYLGVFTKERIADEFLDKHLMILKAKLNDDEPCEILEILAHCHSGPTGDITASVTRRKVYESGFFWLSIFKDAKDYVMRCDACQRSGNISSRSEMPQNNIQDASRKAQIKVVRSKCGKTVYPYGTVEITDKNGISFKVNGQRLKKYYNGRINTEDKEVVEFEEDTT